MAITAKKVCKSLPEYDTVRRMLKTDFPANEQIPYFLLKMTAAIRKGVQFRALYDDDQFCGFIYTGENETHVFVLFFAVNSQIRSKGYGSKILSWLKEETHKTIYLNVEALDPAAPNAVQREKRVAFYAKNGITDTGYAFIDRNTLLSILSSDSEHFDIDSYVKVLRSMFFGYNKKISKTEDLR
ncbi:MAG: GNAT family N-acetyltransferase [Lachnospiraceae bacterium]|nr:GNAT family N-acetyltransferase [Lachnospiraceae bacterium]